MNAPSFQIMVPMRDGTRLNTFVFLPDDGGPRWPAILQRTPYGIAAADAPHKFDHTRVGCPTPPNRCAAPSCAAGRQSSRMVMSPSTRIAAADTAPRARTGSTPMTLMTATTRWNGLPAKAGRTAELACP